MYEENEEFNKARSHKNKPNKNSGAVEQNDCTEKFYRELQQQTQSSKRKNQHEDRSIDIYPVRRKNAKRMKKSTKIYKTHGTPLKKQYAHYRSPRSSREIRRDRKLI